MATNTHVIPIPIVTTSANANLLTGRPSVTSRVEIIKVVMV